MEKVVTLGGRSWNLPPTPLKYIKKLVPLLSRMSNIDIGKATEDQMNDFYEVAFIAVQSADPSIKREAFEDMPITMREVLASIPVLTEQAGLKWREGAPSGEAPAEVSTSTN